MHARTGSISLVLTATALVAGFVFPPISAYTAVYVALGAMVLAGAVGWRQLGGIVRDPAYVVVGLAFLLFTLTLPFVWHGPDDLLIVFAMLPIPIGAGLALLLAAEPRFNSPLVFASFCLIGTNGAVGVGIGDLYQFGLDRAGGGNNPIHYADISVTLGFLSLVGLFGTPSRWRFLFLLGPALGFEAALMAQSRGAMLGAVAAAIPITVVFAYWYRRSKALWIALAAVVVLAGAGFALKPEVLTRAQGGVVQSLEVVNLALFYEDTGSVPVGIDSSTDQRLAMLRAAGKAFLAAPIAGHGASQIIPAAQAYFPERYKDLGNHLHSDLSDFAVAGGLLGLAGYFCFLAAPFVALFRVADPVARRAVLVGALALSGSFFFNGLTNAVFGVLPQTALFGAGLAFIVMIARSGWGEAKEH